MDRVRKIYETTLEMKELLMGKDTPKQRDALIRELDQLIGKRAQEMRSLTEPYTEEEQETGKQLVILNEEVQKMMEAVFANLKQEMKQMKKKKRSNRMYSTPYKNLQSLDGKYMDSKN